MTSCTQRALGAALLVAGAVTLVLLGTSKTSTKPVLLIPVAFMAGGWVIAGRAKS
jgi:hypothetical protein